MRAEPDRAALQPLPALPYLVTDRHLRRVGKDCLVSFAASIYSVSARRVRAGQLVEVRASTDRISLHALSAGRPATGTRSDVNGAESSVLAVHRRATVRVSWVVDPAHWDGLPDGHTRSTVVEPPRRPGEATPPIDPMSSSSQDGSAPNPLAALLARSQAAATPVARRSLTTYDRAAGPSAQPAGPLNPGDPR